MHTDNTHREVWSDYFAVQEEARRLARILEEEVVFSRCPGGWVIHCWGLLCDSAHERERIAEDVKSGRYQRQREEEEQERERAYEEREKESLDRQAAESRQYHAREISHWQGGLARSDESGWFYRD